MVREQPRSETEKNDVHGAKSSRTFRVWAGQQQTLSSELPLDKRKLPKVLTYSQLNQCQNWIMTVYAYDSALQVRSLAIWELLWGGALRLGALFGLKTNNILWTDRRILVSYAGADYRQAWGSKQRHFRTTKAGEYMVALGSDTLDGQIATSSKRVRQRLYTLITVCSFVSIIRVPMTMGHPFDLRRFAICSVRCPNP